MANKPDTQKSIVVDGIVARRNRQPYILLFKGDQQIAQLTLSEARNIANDILIQCSRIEADAMIFKFFEKHDLPEGAASQLMGDFRIFRLELDKDVAETFESVPSADQFDFTKKKPQ